MNHPSSRTYSPLAILATGPSDAHTWNLLYIQLLLEQHGWRVQNLGPCVPAGTLVDQSASYRPDLIVISSINGHGLADGIHIIRAVRACELLRNVPTVIGGKLDIHGRVAARDVALLYAAGYSAVFVGTSAVPDFLELLHDLMERLVTNASLKARC